MSKYLASFTAVILLLFGCSGNDLPSGVLAPEEMQEVFWDYLKADVYANEFLSTDTSKDAKEENARLQLEVFKKHNISKADFYKSYQYYLKHEALMKDMVDTMMIRQQKLYDSTRPVLNVE